MTVVVSERNDIIFFDFVNFCLLRVYSKKNLSYFSLKSGAAPSQYDVVFSISLGKTRFHKILLSQ